MKHQPSNPEPIAQNPWQPKDHNAHNNLENPSPKATQQPLWTQQLREPIAQNPWQLKDHNAHNSLENPSPKTRGNPRTTMDTTA